MKTLRDGLRGEGGSLFWETRKRREEQFAAVCIEAEGMLRKFKKEGGRERSELLLQSSERGSKEDLSRDLR